MWNELIVFNYFVDEICWIIGVDFLEYLSEEGLVDFIGRFYLNEFYGGFCMVYFNGDYLIFLYDYEVEYLVSLEVEK